MSKVKSDHTGNHSQVLNRGCEQLPCKFLMTRASESVTAMRRSILRLLNYQAKDNTDGHHKKDKYLISDVVYVRLEDGAMAQAASCAT